LTANFRWCLTGSPIQNTLEDVGALFAFIRAKPFDSIATFRRFIATPFDQSEEDRKRASARLSLLLDSVCLRRMKKESLNLPEPKDRVRVIELSKEEREQYESTMKIMNRALRQRVGEINKKTSFGMFQVQLQLRILTNHGTFQQPFSWASRRNLQMEREDALFSYGRDGDIKCSSCAQPMPILGTNRVYRKYPERCAHVLCSECLDEQSQGSAVEGGMVLRCPLCNLGDTTQIEANFDYAISRRGEERDDYFRPHGYSSKMAALVADVQQDLWQTKRQVRAKCRSSLSS
jgi:SWI/SNF-related matrix-associated actin-dependent regulator of chromatin subfamily A3